MTSISFKIDPKAIEASKDSIGKCYETADGIMKVLRKKENGVYLVIDATNHSISYYEMAFTIWGDDSTVERTNDDFVKQLKKTIDKINMDVENEQ